MSIAFMWPTEIFQSRTLSQIDNAEDHVADRQDRVPGFCTAALIDQHVLLIGAGGLAGAIAGGLTRKGIGRLSICDQDVCEISNLNRQHFYESDLFASKALRLAANAGREGFLGSICTGHQVDFTEQSAGLLACDVGVAICAVDNNDTRALASRFFRQRKIPVIFLAVDESADYGWIFVQQPSGPCIGCLFPRMAEPTPSRQPCQAVPAVLDILRIVGGLALYAVDTLIMERRRAWNFRSVSLLGSCPDCIDTVTSRSACPLCSTENT